jgi:ribulose-phosphate 3-epimerase
MGVIIPAILPTSREDLEDRLSKLSGLVERVQIDVVDGVYAKPPTWPYVGGAGGVSPEILTEETLLQMGSFRYEVDLMVSNPQEVIGAWISAGANRITIHAGSVHSLGTLITDIQTKYGYDNTFAPYLLSIGIAVTADTDMELIEPWFEHLNYVQFMGIAHVGRQGEPFDERIVSSIASFRKAHPHIPIQVDGAVTLKTAPQLLSAGASRLVVGSDIWHAEDIGAEIVALEELSERYGIYDK